MMLMSAATISTSHTILAVAVGMGTVETLMLMLMMHAVLRAMRPRRRDVGQAPPPRELAQPRAKTAEPHAHAPRAYAPRIGPRRGAPAHATASASARMPSGTSDRATQL
eukprot:4663423-Pleurochrysis_carterae.AAC.9